MKTVAAMMRAATVAAWYLAAVSASDVLVSLPITVDGAPKNLQLMRGESFERAALSFVELNGLVAEGSADSIESRNLIDQLAGMLREKVQQNEMQPQAKRDVYVTLPLTVDGVVGELTMFKDEGAHDAVDRYLRESPLAEDMKTQAHPQLLQMLQQKVQEEQLRARETVARPAFSFDVTLDNQQFTVNHFEGQDPMAEGRAFAQSLNIVDESVLQWLVPQIAEQIQLRIQEAQAQAQAQQAQAQAQQPATRKELPRSEMFSIPITINNQAAVLVHYEGFTSTESALHFLRQNGVTDAETVNTYLRQLVEVIDQQLAEAFAQSQTSTQPPTETPREPLFTIPVTVGGTVQNMPYFEGESPELTSQLFMERQGLTNDPNYAASVRALTSMIRQRVQAVVEEREAMQATPMFVVPLSLGDATHDLRFFAGETPAEAATKFCAAHLSDLQRALGDGTPEQHLEKCHVFLFQTITGMLDKLEQETQTEPQVPTTPTSPDVQVGVLLFTLDIDLGEGRNAALPFRQGDNPEAVARAFCDTYGVDPENVPALVEAIRQQVAGRV